MYHFITAPAGTVTVHYCRSPPLQQFLQEHHGLHTFLKEDQMLVVSHYSRVVFQFLNHKELHVTNSEEFKVHRTYIYCRFKDLKL